MFVLALVLSVAGVPAAFAQEATAEVTAEPPAPTLAPTHPPVMTTDEATPPPATPAPEQTPPVLPETTVEATEPVTPPTPETTEAPTLPPTDAPVIVTTEEPTAEPTEPASPLAVEFVCTEQGSVFVITNNGPDMAEAAFYTLSMDAPPVTEPVVIGDPEAAPADEPTVEPVLEPTDDPALIEEGDGTQAQDAGSEGPTDVPAAEPTPEPEAEGTPFQLLAGEQVIVDAGYGAPSLQIGDTVYEAEGGCALAAPVLSVSAVCVFETGVEFTLVNNGGPMEAEQLYSIDSDDDEPLTGAFTLGAGEALVLEAGYGSPVFASEDLTAMPEEACVAPAEIRGVVWNDLNGDGLRSDDEPGLPGVTVVMTDVVGFSQSFESGAEGEYWFGLLPIATYSLSIDMTTLPTPDFALSYPVEGDGATVLETIAGDVVTADFGVTGLPTASVSGLVWLETGNFGVFDAGETGVPAAVVELVDHTGTVVAAAPVDLLTGGYTFSGVLAGDYVVRLAQDTLFTPNFITFDSDGDYDYQAPVTLVTGQALTDVNFGVVGTF
jgi:hypothetical protein